MDVLVIHAGFGQGHRKAAHAVADAIGAGYYDLLDFTHPLIKKIYSASYLITTQHFPYLWQAAFTSTKNNFISFCLCKLHKIIFSSFFTFLRKSKPKIVIITHFFISDLLSHIKDELKIKTISVITDLRVHPLWVHKCIDYYFVALDATKEDLIQSGVAKDKIFSGFVPLREGFLRQSSKEYLQEKFNLGERPAITFVSSLRGKFPFLKESLDTLLKGFNIFVIYGRNKKLKQYLEDLNSPHIRFFPFYEEIWDLMSLSSVVITKPGGLTVFEGIYKRKPFVFTHYIPGQEKENMDVLINYGVAKFVRNKDELIEAVDYFKREYEQLQQKYPLDIKGIKEPLQDLIRTGLSADKR
jgi:processive 1,2-diacylglycerol beta-glucosyltransferase